MPQLFVSYARESRPQVERLAADLRSSGYEPFFDEQLAGGQNWWAELLSRIEAADAFVPVLGSDYLNSTPCQLEATYAATLGKPFLPIAIENLPPQLFSEAISQAHWAEYDPRNPQSILSVIRAINVLPPTPPLPNPMPERPRVPISYMTELQQEIGGDAEISRNRQLQIVADLRSRLATGDRDAAAMLLQRLRQRPDVGYQVAMDIDQVITAHAGGTVRPQPQQQPQQPQQPQQQQQQPRREPSPGPAYPGPGSAPQIPPQAPRQVAGQAPPLMGKPDSYLVWTVLTTLLCCLPFGIVGIVASVKVDSLWASGQYAEAVEASRKAKMWAQAAGITGGVLLLLYLLYLVIAGLSSASYAA